ncbi:MAG: hypothetical protein GY811_10650 [Myxococcales bacterium]|nr:hypothetical protein [Myxococcales bacterium]
MDFEADNPFEVLGVEVGQTPREIKRAYVRLIKEYRPEKFPKEFEFVHSAYEEATRATEGGYAEMVYGSEEQVTGADEALLKEAEGQRDDTETNEAWIASPEVEHLDKTSHEEPAARWAYSAFVVGDGSELEEALGDHDVEGVIKALRKEEFFEHFREDEYAEELAELAISWLAWRDLDAATKLARRYELASEESAPDPWDSVGLEAVREFQSLSVGHGFAKHVLVALRALLAPNDPGREEASHVLAAEEREVLAIASFVAKSARHENLCVYWVGPLHALLSQYDTVLDSLESDDHPHLSRELTRLGNDLKTRWYASSLSWGVAFFCFVFLHFIGLVLYGLARFSWWAAVERSRYVRNVQPVLAYLALSRGYGNNVVLAWLQGYSKISGGLSGYDVRIASDHGLDLLAALQYRMRD